MTRKDYLVASTAAIRCIEHTPQEIPAHALWRTNAEKRTYDLWNAWAKWKREQPNAAGNPHSIV